MQLGNLLMYEVSDNNIGTFFVHVLVSEKHESIKEASIEGDPKIAGFLSGEGLDHCFRSAKSMHIRSAII